MLLRPGRGADRRGAGRCDRAPGCSSRGCTRSTRPIELGLADCERRELVTTHDAFGYLADRYGLEVIPITGLSPEAEPSPQDLEAVADLVEARGVTTVFTETLLSPEIGETVAREAGATTAVLNPLEGLTEDELARGDDYFSGDGGEPRRAPTRAGMPVAVELEDVSFAYRPGQPVLTDVTSPIEEGEFVAIAGPNGGGKTTLVRLALGLARPASGTVRLFGEPAHRFSRRATLGYVAQRAQIGGHGPVTVREVVGVRPARAGRPPRPAPRPRPGDRRRCDRGRRALRRTRALRLAELSGGQQQRAFIAKALAGEPSCSSSTSRRPASTWSRRSPSPFSSTASIATADVTTLYVSHEFGAVESIVDRLVLVRGGIVFDGPPGAFPSEWHDPSHAHARH